MNFEVRNKGNTVPASARVTNQYLSEGVLISDAALVAAGVGHSASGVNSLAGIDSNGDVNYDQAVTFSFFQPGNSSISGTTDYFSYRTDLAGGSGNTITISAYGIDSLLLGFTSFVETGTFTSPLAIFGVGQFHSIKVGQTLYNTFNGGIAIDLVQFGEILPVSTVPEPGSVALFGLGLAVLASAARRKSV